LLGYIWNLLGWGAAAGDLPETSSSGETTKDLGPGYPQEEDPEVVIEGPLNIPSNSGLRGSEIITVEIPRNLIDDDLIALPAVTEAPITSTNAIDIPATMGVKTTSTQALQMETVAAAIDSPQASTDLLQASQARPMVDYTDLSEPSQAEPMVDYTNFLKPSQAEAELPIFTELPPELIRKQLNNIYSPHNKSGFFLTLLAASTLFLTPFLISCGASTITRSHNRIKFMFMAKELKAEPILFNPYANSAVITFEKAIIPSTAMLENFAMAVDRYDSSFTPEDIAWLSSYAHSPVRPPVSKITTILKIRFEPEFLTQIKNLMYEQGNLVPVETFSERLQGFYKSFPRYCNLVGVTELDSLTQCQPHPNTARFYITPELEGHLRVLTNHLSESSIRETELAYIQGASDTQGISRILRALIREVSRQQLFEPSL
jgi:hypothetical protein